MKKQNAFTLIELLAVIVILAIIALIATPLTLNVIEDAKKGAVKDSALVIARVAELYYMEGVIKGNTPSSIDLTTDTLKYNGQKPEKGALTYSENGRVYIKMYLNGYCVSVDRESNEVIVDKKDKDECKIDVIILSLNAQGGEISEISREYDKGDEIGELPTPVKEGYTFKGWTLSDGTIVTSTTKITETMTIYANWEVNTYIVTLVDGNESTVDQTIQVTYDSSYGNITDPIKLGYAFKGWKLENGTDITGESIVKTASNHNIYAQWELLMFTVTFDVNGGITPISTKTVIYGTPYESLPEPTRDGYMFKGWYDENNNLIEATTIVQIDKDHTLNASWESISYLVTFDANGGSVTTKNTEVAYGETYGSKLGGLPTPSKTGYIFNGWYTDKSSGTVVASDTIMTTQSNHSIYARWTPITYTIKFSANGGSGSVSSITAKYDQTIALPSCSSLRYDSKYCIGWGTSSSASGSNCDYIGLASVKNLTTTNGGTKTLYACWKIR